MVEHSAGQQDDPRHSAMIAAVHALRAEQSANVRTKLADVLIELSRDKPYEALASLLGFLYPLPRGARPAGGRD